MVDANRAVTDGGEGSFLDCPFEAGYDVPSRDIVQLLVGTDVGLRCLRAPCRLASGFYCALYTLPAH